LAVNFRDSKIRELSLKYQEKMGSNCAKSTEQRQAQSNNPEERRDINITAGDGVCANAWFMPVVKMGG
jgi:hypothetical protein